jgi:type IV pilus assembly protein PilC
MPYFKWTGITLIGSLKKGKLAAYSFDELATRLLQQGIALLHCKAVYAPLFLWNIGPLVKSQLCNRIAQLLNAGIMLPEVLTISAQQSSHPLIYDSLFLCAVDIKNGVSCAAALEKQTQLYDSIAVTMLRAGYESGSLIQAFENVSRYYRMQHDFKKGVRSALAIPLVTLFFFVCISLFIFVFIMPRFAEMFASLHHELPPLTRYMLAISGFVRSWSMVVLLIIVVAGCVCIKRYSKVLCPLVWDTMIVHMPFIGQLVYCNQLGQVLNALSLLVMSGVSLPHALKIMIVSVDNSIIKAHLIFLYDEIQLGCLLSDAMISAAIFLPEVIALIRVGEESGSLGGPLEHCSQLYRDILQQKLTRLTFFLQPIMIIVLGLLITALIFSVYLPVMELSHAM